MRAIWAAAFLLRRLRTEVGVALLVFLVVGVTAALLASAPRLLARAADAALLQELTSAKPTERNIEVSVVVPARGNGEPATQLGTRQTALLSSMPESVQSLVSQERRDGAIDQVHRHRRSAAKVHQHVHPAAVPGRARFGDTL